MSRLFAFITLLAWALWLGGLITLFLCVITLFHHDRSLAANSLDLQYFLLLVLDDLVDFAFVLLGEFLHLLTGVTGVVFGDHAAFFFGIDDLVGIAAGVADGDF